VIRREHNLDPSLLHLCADLIAAPLKSGRWQRLSYYIKVVILATEIITVQSQNCPAWQKSRSLKRLLLESKKILHPEQQDLDHDIV